MALISTVGWREESPTWTRSGNDVTYEGLVGGYLLSPTFPMPSDRKVAMYTTVEGEVYGGRKAKGSLSLTGLNKHGGIAYTAVSATVQSGVISAAATFPAGVVSYYVQLHAFAARGSQAPGEEYLAVTFKALSDGVPPVGGVAAGGSVTDANGVVTRGPKLATEKPSMPTSQHDLVRGTKMDKVWYQHIQALTDAIPSPAEIETQAQAAVAAIPSNATRILPTTTTDVQGNQADGYFIGLRPLEDSGEGEALWKFTRDAFGRVEGTEAATTDDLAEGATNLYFTDARLVFNRIDADGDIRVAADGSLRITNGT